MDNWGTYPRIMWLNSYVHSTSSEVQSLFNFFNNSSKRGTLSFVDNKSSNLSIAFPVHSINVNNSICVTTLRQIITEWNSPELMSKGAYYTALATEEHAQLTIMCRAIFLNFHRIDLICEVSSQISRGGQTYGSSASRLLRSSCVKAYHSTDISGQMIGTLGIGYVKKFVRVGIDLKVDGKLVRKKVSFALVEWFSDSEQGRNSLYSFPVEVWGELSGICTFVPVASIVTHVAILKDCSVVSHLSNFKLSIAIPLYNM